MTSLPLLDRDVSQVWVERYLTVLGVDRAAPSLENLAALTRAQVEKIPFENVTSLRRRAAYPDGPVPPPDPDELLGNWEGGRGGGVCFELAGMFVRLLGALGYRAAPVLGQISIPGGHQAVRVALDGDRDRYLLDVGCGGPFFEPIPLAGTFYVRWAGLGYRFRAGETADEWVQERQIDGVWTSYCRYDLRPLDEGLREAAYQRHHTPGQSWVVDRLRLVRCGDDEVYSLTDDELVHFSAAGKRTERVEDTAGYERLVVDAFRLPALPVVEALKAREALAATAAGG